MLNLRLYPINNTPILSKPLNNQDDQESGFIGHPPLALKPTSPRPALIKQRKKKLKAKSRAQQQKNTAPKAGPKPLWPQPALIMPPLNLKRPEDLNTLRPGFMIHAETMKQVLVQLKQGTAMVHRRYLPNPQP